MICIECFRTERVNPIVDFFYHVIGIPKDIFKMYMSYLVIDLVLRNKTGLTLEETVEQVLITCEKKMAEHIGSRFDNVQVNPNEEDDE